MDIERVRCTTPIVYATVCVASKLKHYAICLCRKRDFAVVASDIYVSL